MVSNMFLYLFQVTLIFSVFYIVYQLVLRKLTFHRLNRFILLTILFLSILVPLLTNLVPPIVHPIEEIPQLFEQITVITTPKVPTAEDLILADLPFNYIALMNGLYFLSVVFFLLRFCISIYRLFLLKKQSTIINNDGQILYEAPISNIFSYFHWIFIPQGMRYDPLIIMHEKAHSQLRHTIDVFLAEIYIAFFWWNPLVYLYRKTLKSVHEYQADQYVLRENVKTSDYLQLIVNSLEIKKHHQLYSYFNTPILKKRIDMITKNRSHSRLKITYFLMLPFCTLFFIAFTKPITESSTIQHIVDIIEPVSNTPTFAFPIKGSSRQQITSFFDVNIKDPNTKKNKVHTGIDIKATLGTPIIATADGIVTLAKSQGTWGNLITISHTNDYETWYAHLKGFTISSGDTVKKGDIIGYVGMTGNSSGPHLHYELKHHKKSINPLEHLEK